MQHIAVPPLVPPTTRGTLADLPRRNADEDRAGVVFSRWSDGRWADVTHGTFLQEVRALAKGLVAAGVEVGDRVAIMSRTRYEWTLADFAIWTAGAVSVPVYETSSAEQGAWITGDSGAVAVIVETAAHAATLAEVRGHVPSLRDVWQIHSGGAGRAGRRGA